MQDRKPDRPGRYVCGVCREYYYKKTEERTLERTQRSKSLVFSFRCSRTYINEAGSSEQRPGLSDMANNVEMVISAAQTSEAGSSAQKPGPSNMAKNVQKAIAAAQRQGKTTKWRARSVN